MHVCYPLIRVTNLIGTFNSKCDLLQIKTRIHSSLCVFSANSAAAGAGIIFFLAFIPYFFIQPRYNELTFTEKLTTCLLSNTALALSSIQLAMWEGTGAGARWDNISTSASPDDPLTLQLIFLMFLLDAVLYTVLALYIEAVFPGEYGVPQPWYFPLMVILNP
ncbi:ATP-binding cassette sub-family A member 3-like [Limulus polyphemus]|uniref:ATP-binding cassette sub-family A member 3-like n=1 Tax=Limulus polyphemus TaxID=6850 RepID=A0ABM1TCR5_LIMPO|nr:ATP-binding cassette sub-family A member 3-like [Limulus polyphemus]